MGAPQRPKPISSVDRGTRYRILRVYDVVMQDIHEAYTICNVCLHTRCPRIASLWVHPDAIVTVGKVWHAFVHEGALNSVAHTERRAQCISCRGSRGFLCRHRLTPHSQSHFFAEDARSKSIA